MQNPFLKKFVILNREWIVQNLAMILGGRAYLSTAGAELNYIRHVYQTAVNQQAVQQRVEAR